ncbi:MULTISPECIES: hypothetical protein [Pseudomonas]|uniref:hypothetical protein n=1 Tax=Pseudomonas TaxID=286 RepID=UPI002148304D|nr:MULTISPECIES: hypothetical protein [Pseudomonas]UUT20963.1 hypothetical protein NRG23_25105 [Pseudomonas sp. T8]WJV24122.1 hypothetical protein PSR66_31640 [Pseudomonas chlororaphis]
MTTSLAVRPISIIDYKNPDVEALHPQNTVIAGDNKVTNGKRYLDFGALCYRQRKKRSINRYGKYEGMYINPSSLDIDRLSLISKIIEVARAQTSFLTTVGFHTTIKCFFDWVDGQTEEFKLSSRESGSLAYIGYTKYLLDRVDSSSIRGNSLAANSAAILQVSARQVLSYATGMHDREIALLTTSIIQTDRQAHINLKQLSSDAQSRTFATLIKFIDEAHRLLVEGGDFPIHLISPGSDPYFVYSLHQNTAKTQKANLSMANFLSTCSEFPSWETTAEHFSIPKNNLLYNLNYTNYKKAYIKNNIDKRSSIRLQIANHAMTAGMLAFIGATGCNLSIAQKLDIESSEVLPSTQGYRFFGVKPRANGKTVAPEFGARFTPTFHKILEIRNWLLDGRESNYVFVILPKGTNTIGYVGTSALQTLKKLMRKIYPLISWVPAIQWRKNVSYQYISKSGGDTVLTAEKLSNTESTVAKNYARPALEEFASQITNLLDAIHSTAIAKTRTTEHIPVRIATDKRQEATIGVGGCVKKSDIDPQRTAGFTEQAPKPSCRDPETCLFCDFYSVHADEDDIRRLLSLRFVIMATKPNIDHEHWIQKIAPTVHRIDEVLSAISHTGSNIPFLISQIRNEVELGHLDEFWAIHFDTLVHIGAVV